jgi:hypothetical protein
LNFKSFIESARKFGGIYPVHGKTKSLSQMVPQAPRHAVQQDQKSLAHGIDSHKNNTEK